MINYLIKQVITAHYVFVYEMFAQEYHVFSSTFRRQFNIYLINPGCHRRNLFTFSLIADLKVFFKCSTEEMCAGKA